MRNCIIKRKEPYKDWALHPVTVVAKYDSYDEALNKEKRLMEKSTTESEVDLGRGMRKKKSTYRTSKKNDDYCSDSSEEEQETSEDSIPEYESPSNEKNANDVEVNDVAANDVDANDVDANNDVNANENIGGAGVHHIVDINNIPVVIEGNNETLDSVLRNVIEIKELCRRIDERLNNGK
ncbi:uncharacterized protein [Temnothorax longispinosus]|uniref:uncharacterized protein n=1 Tax=Temnothorax longispinosus TaxID=300112 RepID=UPI003A997FCA